MNKEDFPALYRATSKTSMAAQAEFFRVFGFNLILLAVAVALSVFYISDIRYIYLQIVVLFLSLGCTALIGYRLPEKIWYGGRALAESVKTLTWRYMVKAAPFDIDDDGATKLFITKLKEIVESNKEITKKSVNLTV